MDTLILLSVVTSTLASANAADPPYFIGEIMPTPQRASYEDRFIPVYDITHGRPLVSIIAGPGAERLAAEDLIARILELAGRSDPGFQPRSAQQPVPAGDVICIGTADSNRALAALSVRPGLALYPRPRGEQGYVIRCADVEGRQVCLAAGGGAMGSYFATMSLLQLLTVEDGTVLLRRARVDDWPAFELRGACCYTPVSAAWLARCKFSTMDMNYGAHGRDGWRDPDAMGVPPGWGQYSGAGHLRVVTTQEQPHSGARCVRAEIGGWYEGWADRPHAISAALMVGRSNGYTGTEALVARPGRYRLSLWLRGEVPHVQVGVVTWRTDRAQAAERDFVEPIPSALPCTEQWVQHELDFSLPEGPARFAVRLSIVGQQADGLELGQGFCVDDLVLTHESAATNLAENGDLEAGGTPYTDQVAALWGWAAPRGLWPVQYVNPLDVSGWEDDGALKIQVSDPEQIDDLADTFRISLDRGGTWVMLALDDFASKLGGPAPHYIITNEADRAAFSSLGECHGTLVRELHARLKATHPHCRLLVCPAYYWIPAGAYREEGEKYLREFGALVPEDVLIVWTGPYVRSRTITGAHVRHYSSLIGRAPYLWDNTIYARHAQPTYVLDPFDSQYPPSFEHMIAGGLHSNGGADGLYRVGSLIYADYAWNPDAYDPTAALERALRMVLGEGCVEPAHAFREHYYAVRDPYYELARDISAMTREQIVAAVGPLDAATIAQIAEHVAAMDEALAQLRERSPNTELIAELDALAEPLRRSATRLVELGAITAELQHFEGGVIIPESAFVGGSGHQVYEHGCEPRRATWIYGQGTQIHTMTATFALDPTPPQAALVIVGQDHDKQGVTRVEVLVNGTTVYSGPNGLGKRGWYHWQIALPSGILQAGVNTVTIRNLEPSASTNSEWFMLAEARLLFD